MSKIKTLLIDDERLARNEMRRLLQQFDEVEIVGEAANADEASVQIDQLKPDLLFLDIQMPGKTGFELLEQIDFAPLVIFVTAYDEYAIRAFEVNALDYLLKPVDENKLKVALDKAKKDLILREPVVESQVENQRILREDERVFLKDGDKYWFVNLKDIRYFESNGNYVQVFFDTHKPMVLKSLNKLEEKLSEKLFFRAGRKFIINLNFVEKIEPSLTGGLLVVMSDKRQIEISRRQAAKLKDKMTL